MRMRWSGALACALGAMLIVTAACNATQTSPPASSSDSGTTSADGGTKDFATGGADGGPMTGAEAVAYRGCPKCHGSDMAGSTAPLPNQPAGVALYPPNLTPDPATGVGQWTDLQLHDAIVDGVDKEGLRLCPQMKHYGTMTDAEVAAIIGYMRALPAVNKVIPGSSCPPLKG